MYKFAILTVVGNGTDMGGDAVDFFEVFVPNHDSIGFDLYCERTINWLKYQFCAKSAFSRY